MKIEKKNVRTHYLYNVYVCTFNVHIDLNLPFKWSFVICMNLIVVWKEESNNNTWHLKTFIIKMYVQNKLNIIVILSMDHREVCIYVFCIFVFSPFSFKCFVFYFFIVVSLCTFYFYNKCILNHRLIVIERTHTHTPQSYLWIYNNFHSFSQLFTCYFQKNTLKYEWHYVVYEEEKKNDKKSSTQF